MSDNQAYIENEMTEDSDKKHNGTSESYAVSFEDDNKKNGHTNSQCKIQTDQKKKKRAEPMAYCKWIAENPKMCFGKCEKKCNNFFTINLGCNFTDKYRHSPDTGN